MAPLKKICPITNQQFIVDDRDLEFYKRVSPSIGGTQYLIPSPTFSPDSRQQRRLAFRNERYLYKSTCAISKKPIISVYSPDKLFKVCAKDVWLDVDNTQFGRDYDFSRPFFEQYSELFRETYKLNLMQAGDMENSEYSHFCGWLKNCYWVFDMGKSEDCSYGIFLAYCRNSMDGLYLSQCELCYESVKLENCYQVRFSAYSSNCHSSAFLYECIGCKHCICCTNLRNKEYYVFNEHVGKEKYEQLWEALCSGSYIVQEEWRNKFEALLQRTPRKATHNINCEDCSGDDLGRCANVHDSFNCLETKDCRFVYDMYMRTHDCYDIATFGECMDYCYELSGCGGRMGHSQVSNCFFSLYIYYGGFNILYSNSCHENSQNLFGCCDLRKKQFCILNKQYSKEEYERLVPKIIEHMRSTGEWGEFFPVSLSPFGYNESLAQEFYPLAQSEAQTIGASWSSYSSPAPAVKKIIKTKELPDKASEVGSEILECAIVCEATGKPFRIIKPELEFYRQEGLPLPRFHSEERHRRRRHQWLNPRKLWQRNCAKTGKPIQSSYDPQSKVLVYSDRAFEDAVD